MEQAAAKTYRPRTPARSGRRTLESASQVQSLVRALALLNSIAESPDNCATLTDLALKVGLPPSTAHRLLTTLEQERYVKFNPEGRQWAIGVQAFVTGCSFTKTRSLVAIARPYMRRLMEDSGETTNLAVEDEGEAVYLAQVECRQMMRVFSRPGSRVPLHCSAVGKAMLSAMSGKRLSKILQQRGMPRLTVKTIAIPAALRADLDRVRTLGYALDDEEHHVGSRCVAAPIFDETCDVIAAVSASGPIVRIDEERIPQLGALVLETAREISAALGANTAKIGGDGVTALR